MSVDGVTIRAAHDYEDIAEILACPRGVRDTLQLPYVAGQTKEVRRGAGESAKCGIGEPGIRRIGE